MNYTTTQDEANDFLELEIQNIRAYQGIKGDFIDHGHSSLTLAQNQQLQFPLYDDYQLSFLDTNTQIGAEISRSIVKAEFDDDVATDDDMKVNAEKLLNRELTGAIDKYLKCKNKAELVKNVNLEKRFKNLKVWEESENEN
jgi:hypothetical protein